METLGQDSVLSLHLRRVGMVTGQDYPWNCYLAGGAGQGLLILPDLLLENLVHVRCHLDLLQALNLPLQDGCVLLKMHTHGLLQFLLKVLSPAFSWF